MTALDLTALLEPLSADAPCGPNLEYDEQFGAMQRAAQGKAEQQFGQTVVAAEEPNWREMQQQAQTLLGRTKDLRVGVELARASLNTTGIADFCEVLGMLAQWVERYWAEVHPQLDPDDDNDPILRANTLAALADPESTLNYLLRAPLASSRAHGRFSLRDISIAAGDTPAPAGMAPPTTGQIEAAFGDSDPAELQALAARLQDAVAATRQLMATFNEQTGAAGGIQLSGLIDQLVRMQGIMDQQLLRRGLTATANETDAGAAESGAAAGAAPQAPSDGEIHSREDVVRMLERICTYYSRHEPSSPIPLLLRRAQRLTSASFLDILRDLAPAGIDQAASISGPGGSENGDAS